MIPDLPGGRRATGTVAPAGQARLRLAESERRFTVASQRPCRLTQARTRLDHDMAAAALAVTVARPGRRRRQAGAGRRT